MPNDHGMSRASPSIRILDSSASRSSVAAGLHGSTLARYAHRQSGDAAAIQAIVSKRCKASSLVVTNGSRRDIAKHRQGCFIVRHELYRLDARTYVLRDCKQTVSISIGST